MKIADLPRIERPREKLIKYGPEKLSDEELFAILVRTGRAGKNVLELSKELVKIVNQDINNLSIQKISKIKGIGPTKSVEIIACFEIGKRFLKDKKRNIILSPEDVWKELTEIRRSKREHFVVLFLDSRNQAVKKEVISIGTINSSLVHPREVFESAIKNSAASIIIAHNHPSNLPDPSENDIDVTKTLIAAGELLDIKVLDHVIVTEDSWFSFKENKVLF
ncbi:MAG: DNA repair protein RadC [Candidatus Dojkabacteria bacterium]